MFDVSRVDLRQQRLVEAIEGGPFERIDENYDNGYNTYWLNGIVIR